MQAFRIEGTLPMGRKVTPFMFETVAADEKTARDYALSTMGSRHRVNRHNIKITNVRSVPKEQIEDLAVARAYDLASKS